MIVCLMPSGGSFALAGNRLEMVYWKKCCLLCSLKSKAPLISEMPVQSFENHGVNWAGSVSKSSSSSRCSSAQLRDRVFNLQLQE